MDSDPTLEHVQAGLRAFVDMDAANQLVRALRRLTADICIPSLRALGVPRERLLELAPSMADAALASGSPGNNPRQATRDEIIE